jgi:hypothetical protein
MLREFSIVSLQDIRDMRSEVDPLMLDAAESWVLADLMTADVEEGEEEGKESTQFAVEGNCATATSKSSRITTLEQLIEACKIDLEVWRIERWLCNKWEVGAKTEHKVLTWDRGVMDGSVRAEGLSVEALFQVKAWLVKRHPEPIFPVLQPVVASTTYVAPSLPEGGLLRSLVFADPHFWFTRDDQSAALSPLHDRRALDIVLQIADAVQPDRIDMLGDSLDMTDWTTKFVRTPDFTHCTQPSLLECHWWLAQFRATCPTSVINVHEGNHDKRLRSALLQHLPAAYGLKAADEMELPPALSLPKLLGLPGLGIGWTGEYPDDESWLGDSIMLQHGDIARVAGNSTKAVVERADYTTIMGHIHKLELCSRVVHSRDGLKTISAFCPGCLCHIDGRVPATRGRQQWQQGCAVVDYDLNGRLHSILPVIIDEGEAVWNGMKFQYRDRRADLRCDMPDWNWN